MNREMEASDSKYFSVDSKFETKADGPDNFKTHIFLTVNPNPHYPYSWTGGKFSKKTRHVFEITCFIKDEKERLFTFARIQSTNFGIVSSRSMSACSLMIPPSHALLPPPPSRKRKEPDNLPGGIYF